VALDLERRRTWRQQYEYDHAAERNATRRRRRVELNEELRRIRQVREAQLYG